MKFQDTFKIACDNHVSLKTMLALRNYGYNIVYRAWSEEDDTWCNNAVQKGATVFISCDWDIEFFCNKNDLTCIRIPQGKGGKAQRNFITKQLKRLSRKSRRVLKDCSVCGNINSRPNSDEYICSYCK